MEQGVNWFSPDEALLVEVDDERIVRGDEDIQPQVGLVAVDEERVVDVLGHYHWLFQRHLPTRKLSEFDVQLKAIKIVFEEGRSVVFIKYHKRSLLNKLLLDDTSHVLRSGH